MSNWVVTAIKYEVSFLGPESVLRLWRELHNSQYTKTIEFYILSG